MKRFVLFAALAVALVAVTAFADTKPQMVRDGGTHYGQAINMSKASGDTLYLIGNPFNLDQVGNAGPPQSIGTFQDADPNGNPTWNGWTHDDLTFSADIFWQVSDFNVVNGAYSYWCGTDFDGNPGYGNDWNQVVIFKEIVTDSGVASVVNLTMTVQNDTEPDYDYTYVEWNQGGTWIVLAQYDGNRTYAFAETFTVNPGEYVGAGADEIQIRIRFFSDGAWSDEDGLWETNGACQVDDITVIVDAVTVDFEDFEDGVADRWLPDVQVGVGDYAALYVLMQDEDICVDNLTPQVAFIDNGVVVPGTGGTQGQTWRYGPGGFIVNNEGGLAGPDYYINNIIISPVLTWQAGNEACYIEFGYYRHEELGAYNTWPGMFYQWHVRSVNTGTPADLEDAPWQNRNFVQYGGPNYGRQREIVTDLLEVGRTHMQVGLRVIEYGYVWGWVGTDGTPAPYFDNVMAVSYPFEGPGIAGRPIDWYQDNFPASGVIDLVDLGANDVALDCAQNIAQASDLVIYPGDTMWVDVAAVRAGSVLNDEPKMFVKIFANPLFGPGLRSLPANFSYVGNNIEGWAYGDTTWQMNTTPPTMIEDRWNWGLPDEDFFFPGDVLKWYIEAQDNVLGDVGTTLLPADTSGFASADYDLDYPLDYIVRALPTLNSTTPGDQPEIIFWNDFVNRGGDNEWLFALNNLGYKYGVDYDMYATNGPSSGVGNGLGSRATSTQLAGYETMLYTSGNLSVNLLANGDFDNDPSPDISVVTNWLNLGDKNAFFTGDDLVTGLEDAGPTGNAFVTTFFGVNYIQKSVLALIQNQTAPTVAPLTGNSVFTNINQWIAYGGCLGINDFDALEVIDCEMLAEFLPPNGTPGVNPYPAALRKVQAVGGSDVIMMPTDFMYLYNVPGWSSTVPQAGLAARTVVLHDVLYSFTGSGTGGSPVIGVNDLPGVVTVKNYPNPFNPKTTIELYMPKAGDVSMKVFNVRGELVRTLVNGHLEIGLHPIVWSGETDSGNRAASGVYFYETRVNGEVKVNKMALVK